MQKIMYFSLFDNHIWFSIKVEWTQVYNTSLFCLMLVVALCCQLPRQYKEKQRDYKVGKHHVDPDFKVQRRHECKESRLLLPWFPVQNADAEGHEGV